MAAASEIEARDPEARGSSASALALAGLAAVLASACCVVPLGLAIVGVSGAWISRLRWLEPYSPWLMALAIASLALAGWRLYRPAAGAAAACDSGDEACRTINAAARRWFWVVAVLALIPLVVPLAAPLFY